MRSCKKVFEWVQIRPWGDVTLCAWNWISIGNLKENTLKEIWNSEKANKVRSAFVRGELSGCDVPSCPACINNSEKDLIFDEEEIKRISQQLPDLPTKMCLSFDERCNHACPSCRHTIYVPDKSYKNDMKKICDNLGSYLSKMDLEYFDANGGGEIFCSKEMLDMLSEFHPKREDFLMRLETNGVLLKENWTKVEHLGKWMRISVTVNSYDRATYKYLAGGYDDLPKVEESLAFAAKLKKEGKIKEIEITMVIQDSNFRQIPDFIQKSLETYHADRVILRPIFKWFYITYDELLYKNVLNPCHPYHKEYLEIIENPVCKDSRVFNWGYKEKQEAITFPTLDMKKRIMWQDETREYVENRMCDLKNKINISGKDKKIYLFGAGRIGKLLLEQLTSGDEVISVEGFAVSCMDGNPKRYMGYPVVKFDEIAHKKDCIFILATTNEDFENEMLGMLRKQGITNYISINKN